MRFLKGKATDSKGKGVYNAIIYISDKNNKELYAKKYRARTDADGKFSIALPPQLLRTERWINLLDSSTAKRSRLKINDYTNQYDFENTDKGGGGVATIDEVQIGVDKKKPKKKKKNYKPFIIGGSILVALLLGYVVYKEMKKKN